MIDVHNQGLGRACINGKGVFNTVDVCGLVGVFHVLRCIILLIPAVGTPGV